MTAKRSAPRPAPEATAVLYAVRTESTAASLEVVAVVDWELLRCSRKTGFVCSKRAQIGALAGDVRFQAAMQVSR